MKQFFNLLILIGIFGSLGCDGDGPAQVQDWAILATKELGIPVNLWALPEDSCATAQLRRFAEDYRRLGSKERAVKKSELAKKYRSITVNGTRDLGRMYGSRIDVQLRHKVCEWHVRPMRRGEDPRYQECSLRVVATMKAQETRKVENGAVPGTLSQVEGEAGTADLQINPRSALNYSYEGLLRTDHTKTFARAVKRQPGHEEDLRAGWVTIVREQQNKGELYCGRLMGLEEIL